MSSGRQVHVRAVLVGAAFVLASFAPGVAQAPVVPSAKLHLKNNTTSAISCTLFSGQTVAAQLRLAPGKEYTRSVSAGSSRPVLSLACPGVRAAPYKPLAPGKRYVFLRIRGRIDLTEVTTP